MQNYRFNFTETTKKYKSQKNIKPLFQIKVKQLISYKEVVLA